MTLLSQAGASTKWPKVRAWASGVVGYRRPSVLYLPRKKQDAAVVVRQAERLRCDFFHEKQVGGWMVLMLCTSAEFAVGKCKQNMK